jgi:hypothetical protein
MKRDARPIFIGAAINKLLSRLGAKASDGELSDRWADIVGDNSALIKLSRGVRDRTAYVRAKNPAERLALSYQADDIAEKINAYFGYNAVAKVVIR